MFVQLTKDFQGQKAGTRIDVTEADAKTLLDAGLAAKLEGDQHAPLIAKSMEGMLASISDTMTKSIDAALKQVADAHTKSNKNKVKAIFGDGGPRLRSRTSAHSTSVGRLGRRRFSRRCRITDPSSQSQMRLPQGQAR